MALALYRKYRPRTFAEVIGQEHVTEPLSQALRSGRLHHAYLFSGPRGCGKTSSARILARSLNCERGPTPEPCGVCDSCRALAPDGSGSIDVIEIDAASHGGVDDARELRERAFFAPASSRFKIYVIDEAHMVSTQGFNALLKLVEEPPDYVKFIFATTEPDKVLGTIKSRTHHYPFRLIPPGILRPYLEQLADAENAKVEQAVFPLVVRAGGGSARDTLSVLDQLIAGAGPEGVSYARAVALLGVTDAALIDEMCDALAASDGAAAYATIDRVAEAGHDPRRFASDLLERLRDLIVMQQVPEAAAKGLIDGPTDQLERMNAQAQRLGPATLSRCADIVHNGLIEMRGTTAPRLLLELVTARMLLPTADRAESDLLQRLERMERRLAIMGDQGYAPEEPADDYSGPAVLAGRGPGAARQPGGSTDRPTAGGAGGSASEAAPRAAAGDAAGTQTATGGGAAAARAAVRGAAARAAAGGGAAGTPAANGGAAARTPARLEGDPAEASEASGGGAAGVPAGSGGGGARMPAGTGGGGASGTGGGVAGVPADSGGGAARVPAGSGGGAAGMPAGSGGDAAGSSVDPAGGAVAATADRARGGPRRTEIVPDDDAVGDELTGDLPAASGVNSLDTDGAHPGGSQTRGTDGAAAEDWADDAVAATVNGHDEQPRRVVPPQAVMADPATPEPVIPEAGAPGEIDAAAVRRVWDEIVSMVRVGNKKIAALASEATVRDVDGDTLVLTFRHAFHARTLAESPEPLSDAVYEVLGGRWQIRCELAGDERAGGPGPGPASARPAGGRESAGSSAPAGGRAPGQERGGRERSSSGRGESGASGDRSSDEDHPAAGSDSATRHGPGPVGAMDSDGRHPAATGRRAGDAGGGGRPANAGRAAGDAGDGGRPANAGRPAGDAVGGGGPVNAGRAADDGGDGGRPVNAGRAADDGGDGGRPVNAGRAADDGGDGGRPVNAGRAADDGGDGGRPANAGRPAGDAAGGGSSANAGRPTDDGGDGGRSPNAGHAADRDAGYEVSGATTTAPDAGEGQGGRREANGLGPAQDRTKGVASPESGPERQSRSDIAVDGDVEQRRSEPRAEAPVGQRGAGGVAVSRGEHGTDRVGAAASSRAGQVPAPTARDEVRATAAIVADEEEDWPETALPGGLPAGDEAGGEDWPATVPPALSAGPAVAASVAVTATPPSQARPTPPAPTQQPAPRPAPAPAQTPASGGAAAAARAAARAAAGGGRPKAAPAPAKTPGKAAEAEWAGEPPFDPDYDTPTKAARFEGFDPGDEPTDEVIDERTARQSSEQQAFALLHEALGAERIGEVDLK